MWRPDSARATVDQLHGNGEWLMCLGVPGLVLEVRGGVALVNFFGVQRDTRLDLVDEPVAPGDYILNHVGFAIRRIPASEIGETLALYERLLQENDADMMAADVRGEIDATMVGPVRCHPEERSDEGSTRNTTDPSPRSG